MWTIFKKAILTKAAADTQKDGKLDFFKMICAAVAVGLGFSLAAAAATLLLARSTTANANNAVIAESTSGRIADDETYAGSNLAMSGDLFDTTISQSGHGKVDLDTETHQPTPGNLFIADGCGGEFIAAIERDFQIVVKDGQVEIQIMQTFVLPGTDGNRTNATLDASFHAVLPKNALYSSFRVVTRNRDWIGQYTDHADHADLDYDQNDFLTDAGKLQKRGLLRVYESLQPLASNTLSTDPMLDLREGESIVVTYRYLMPIDSVNGLKQISIALSDPIYPQDPQQDSDFFLSASNGFGRTSTSVWVAWIGLSADPLRATFLPKILRTALANLSLEYQHDQITGASWQTADVQQGDQFILAW